MEKLALSVDINYCSPYALSAYVALSVKKLAFEIVEVDLYSKQHQSGDCASHALAQSITARVPVLSVGTFALSESSAICEYLEELYPPPQHAPLYPQNLQQRARARQVQAWVRSDLMAIRTERSTHTVFYNPSTQALTADAQNAAAKLIAVAETLIIDADTGMFGEWCIADTDLAMMLMRLVSSGDPVPEKVLRYVKQQWQHPSVQQWLAMPRPALPA